MYCTKDPTDFLQLYATMNGFYSTFFLSFSVSVYLLYQSDTIKEETELFLLFVG